MLVKRTKIITGQYCLPFIHKFVCWLVLHLVLINSSQPFRDSFSYTHNQCGTAAMHLQAKSTNLGLYAYATCRRIAPSPWAMFNPRFRDFFEFFMFRRKILILRLSVVRIIIIIGDKYI